jgi:hypothetical protein
LLRYYKNEKYKEEIMIKNNMETMDSLKKNFKVKKPTLKVTEKEENKKKEPEIIKIDNINYYKAEDLKEYDIGYFIKTNKTIREIIKNKKIPEKEYNYYCYNTKEEKWKESKLSARAKLFIKKELEDDKKINNELENKYDELPEILKLKDNEKFQDMNGNILKIDTRGKRECDECYFKVKDISKEFNMERINDVITDKRFSGYILNKHYKYFTSRKNKNTVIPGDKITGRKTMYLTYWGLVRLLPEGLNRILCKIGYTFNIVKKNNEQEKMNEILKNKFCIKYMYINTCI